MRSTPKGRKISANKNFSPLRVSVVSRMSHLNPSSDILGSSILTGRNSYPNSSFKTSPGPFIKSAGVFNPKLYSIPGLSEQDIDQLKEVFDVLDKDGNGILAPHEIRAWLIKSGFKATKETVYDIIAEYDEDEKGGLQFGEFLRLMVRGSPNSYETKEEIMKIFKKFDKNKDGFITIDDLRSVKKDLSEDIDEDSLKLIITKSDSNMDGKISFEDFYNVVTREIAL